MSTNLQTFRLANSISEACLHSIKFLCTPESSMTSNPRSWVEFCDRVLLFQTVALENLSLQNLFAFFANTYYIILCHGCWVFQVVAENGKLSRKVCVTKYLVIYCHFKILIKYCWAMLVIFQGSFIMLYPVFLL